MEGLGHGATGSKPGSMWQIVAATKPPEPCLRRGAGFMPGACALMASDSPFSLFEVLPCLFSAIQAGGALAAAGRTVRERATASEDLDEERPLLPKTASGGPLAAEGRTARRAPFSIVAGMCQLSLCWGPTFDMSGGAKGAKRPLGRPLDGGVRPRRWVHKRRRLKLCREA